MADITLSTAVRANLLSLSRTTDLIDRTQGRLSTGLKVASPIDNAVAFFQAKSLSDRAGDLADRKDGIDQGVSSLETALTATEAIEDLTKQIKGIIDTARSADATQRAELADQVEELADQIQNLVNDASYQGLNLLNSTASTLSVRFSDKADSKLDVSGVDFNLSTYFLATAGTAAGATEASLLLTALGFTTGGLSSFSLSLANELASFNSMADRALTSLDKTISNLRSKASAIASNVAILSVRLNFTSEYVDTLESGASKLTVADLNEEGANLLALQTRQQLGIQSLSFAGQSEQSILGLFR
ncbi:MAG: hypothetical protein KDE22_14315 [Rhodobacterales bacterium]|nr:hypothetical protein [Rhodobacterales bacterium]